MARQEDFEVREKSARNDNDSVWGDVLSLMREASQMNNYRPGHTGLPMEVGKPVSEEDAKGKEIHDLKKEKGIPRNPEQETGEKAEPGEGDQVHDLSKAERADERELKTEKGEKVSEKDARGKKVEELYRESGEATPESRIAPPEKGERVSEEDARGKKVKEAPPVYLDMNTGKIHGLKAGEKF